MTKVTDLVAEDSDFLIQSERGAANGVASLDAGGKVPSAQLPTLAGGLDLKGTWNASTNTPALSDGSGDEAGDYYVVATAGTTSLDGEADWSAGDWVIFDGTAWDKIDNSELITSVFGRTGAVAAASGDYDASEISETAGEKIMTAAERTKLQGIETAADVTDATNVAAAGATMDADFDANTILKADSDNTPAALTVAEQRLVGRITSGVITALTAAQVRTLINVADGANAYTHPNHSGDVTSAGDGAQTIANSAVTNAKLADMLAWTLKMRGTGSTGAPQDVKISALTEEVSPDAGDFVLAERAEGELRKIDLGNLTGPGVSSFEGRTGAVVATSGDYAASEVTNTPAGGVAATTVQAAIDELDTEKEAADAAILKSDTSATLVVGFQDQANDAGTKSSGTWTPAIADGNLQNATAGGSFTLGVPTGEGMIVVILRNDGIGGYTFTTTGWDKVIGTYDSAASKVMILTLIMDSTGDVLIISDSI